MTITFLQLPGTVRVPGTYVEVDPNRVRQAPRIQPYQLLVVGQKLSAGTAAALTLQRVRSPNDARQLFGRGSQLAQALERALAVSKSVPVFAVGLADPSGAAATGTLTFTGPATEAGEVDLYIGGRRVPVTVASGDTATTIAAAAAAAITANPDLSVSASPAAGVVTLTAKHVGTVGNLIDVRHSYQDGEKLPAGVGLTVVPLASGTGDVDVSGVWAVLGDQQFNVMAFGLHDATNLGRIEAELLDRFGPIRQLDGQAIVARNADQPTLVTLGLTRNSKHLTILGLGQSPTVPWEIAAQAAGQVAVEGQADPARPFETLPLPDVLGPARSDRFTFAQKDELLHSGIATAIVDQVGVVRLERVITTYRLDDTGLADPSYLDVTTLLTVSFLRFDFRATMREKYARFKIGDDNVRYSSGQPILTPNAARAEALAKFREWEERGLVEGADQFSQDLVVERNASDASRLDFFLPADLTNGLVVVGVRLSFLL